MAAVNGHKAPVLLMVSGGSDSTALLEMAACGAEACHLPQDRELSVLHVNHQLRGSDADADEAFVVARCEDLGVPCTVRRVDVRELAQGKRGGIEATARLARYQLADEMLDAACDRLGVARQDGIVCTAHTLDDRVETFYMRTLVGTGPGGLASIPRMRGRVRRPLLDSTREELRAWLRARHPGMQDRELWREDATNEDGSNFRSQVRTGLLPALRALRPGFERALARTMDLIAEEDADLAAFAEGLVRENASWEDGAALLPVAVLAAQPRALARRAIRAFLLSVYPDARLESAQIKRICEHLDDARFTTETSGGIRVQVRRGQLRAFKAQ